MYYSTNRMRLRPLTLGFILTLVLTQSFAQSRQAATGMIEVRVTESEEKPLGRVTVRLIPYSDDKETETAATTDGSGRAVFRRLGFGQYTVRVERNGYREREFDAHPAGNPRLTIDESSLNHVVRLRLVPESVISGRVRDANGRPLPGATVTLLRMLYQSGHKQLDTARATNTNDRGEYRIFGLPAAEYYVRIDNPDTSADEGMPYISRTYYPGTNDIRNASPVVLKEGQEAGGINLDVRPAAKGVTLSGTVINPQTGGEPQTDGSVARPIRMFMIPDRDGPAEAVWLTPKADSDTGARFSFEVRNVPPGEYLLYAFFNDRTKPVDDDPDAYSPPRFFSSRLRIDVRDKDIGNLLLTMHTGTEIRGRVTVHGEDALNPGFRIRTYSGPNAVQFRSLVQNLPSGWSALTTFPGYMQDDNTFKIANLLEGRYQLAYMWSAAVSQTDYLEDLRQDGRSVYDEGTVTVGPQGTDVEIVVNRNGGRIQGTVDIPLDEPAYVTVVLVPNAPRRANPVLYKSDPMNADRTFSLTGVAPGNYKLFAFSALPRGTETSPEFLAPYEQRGIAVTARAGIEVQAAPVPVIRPK
jgi:hypothetical protein